MTKPKSNKKIKVTFECTVNKTCYELLEAYMYNFERNIQEMIENDARNLAQCLILEHEEENEK